MKTLILSKTVFSFIQFGDCLVIEIWIDNEEGKNYNGEMVLSMN
jgi:hypothetical protein